MSGAKQAAAWRAAHPIESAAHQARYRASHAAQIVASGAAYYVANRDKFRAAHLRTYGITPDQYANKLAAQGGVCALCGGIEPNGHNLSIDHNHECCPGPTSCGQCVRGLLCRACNANVAKVEFLPNNPIAMALYLGATL